MNSVELYNKLRGFWAKSSSRGTLSPPPSVKHTGKRYIFKMHGNLNAVWYKVKWLPTIPKKAKLSSEEWTRLSYEEFCYALGLEMIP